VTDLTADSFLAALTRFVSRRGLPKDVFSDCGTNFVGANTKLKRIIKEFWKSKTLQNEVNHFCIQHQVNFHFNPPASPHQGGLWESAVKSMKHHLYRTIGQSILTVEEYFTITTKVEAMLNSRPITPISSDPNDYSALTPAHFLVGSTLHSVPETCYTDKSPTQLRRWQNIQSVSQKIWQRWNREYLYTLQRRIKWNKKTTNLKIGDLVLIEDNNCSSLNWPLGRIISTHPGKDGIVRVVTVKTASGVLCRPSIKVFPLPIENY
jgi:hypothetical protein